MKIIRSPQEMRSIASKIKRNGKKIGLVPTMGALHEGHLSLIKRALKENNIVVVSIFVNPKQFGPKEDYILYPRPFKKDIKVCEKIGADYVFSPKPIAMYPKSHLTFVNVEKLSEVLCGKSRPGHFRGVATIVAKLFNIIQPDKAYFGMKDYQQLKIIEQMAKDLDFPVKIVSCPIIREKSGLALSSRNQYLSISQHNDSPMIYQSLQSARDLIKSKKAKNAEKITKILKKNLLKIPDSKIDYISILNAKNMGPLNLIKPPIVIAVAVWVGKTRLIDNIVIEKYS
ncbi:MAG: pantoate--beta-alanine ligase [Elusimicrobia bacterium]|nr:pantoate--beta-alanine ligase [Elusimicrobiota bacterium]